MATKNYSQIKSVMAVCMADAEEISRQMTIDPTSEDIRACGIAMFIEAGKAAIDLTDRMRFVARCYDLVPALGEDRYKMVLAEFGANSPTDILDLETMKAVAQSMAEEAANSPNANPGDEA